MKCSHPHLTHIGNIEMGGEESTTYQCDKCKDLFTVTIAPMEADYGVMGTDTPEVENG